MGGRTAGVAGTVVGETPAALKEDSFIRNGRSGGGRGTIFPVRGSNTVAFKLRLYASVAVESTWRAAPSSASPAKRPRVLEYE